MVHRVAKSWTRLKPLGTAQNPLGNLTVMSKGFLKFLFFWIQSLCMQAESKELRQISHLTRASLMPQKVKNLPAMWETWVWSLGWDDPLEEVMATHSSILAWRICMDRGYNPWDCKESDTNNWLSTAFD